jgi:hypothetical protein
MDTATTSKTPTGGWQTADTSGSQAKPNHPDQTQPRGGPCKTKPSCRGKQLGGQKQPNQGVFLNHNKMSAPRPNQGVMPNCAKYTKGSGQSKPNHGDRPNQTTGSGQSKPNQGVKPRQTIPRGQAKANQTKGSCQSKANQGVRPKQSKPRGQARAKQTKGSGQPPKQTKPRGLIEQSNGSKVIGKLGTKSELYQLRTVWTDGIQVHASGLRGWNLHSSPGLQVHGTIRKQMQLFENEM